MAITTRTAKTSHVEALNGFVSMLTSIVLDTGTSMVSIGSRWDYSLHLKSSVSVMLSRKRPGIPQWAQSMGEAGA